MFGVPFHFRGLQSLKIKETDRIVALQRELAKLGFKIESRNDCELLWDGSRCEDTENIDAPVVIDTYEDHRMAMAFAPVALKKGSVLINEPQVVSKSYPRYWLDLESVGMEICMIE
jgi:3-phosphoshikimate 1-carboxyvinyltransferase